MDHSQAKRIIDIVNDISTSVLIKSFNNLDASSVSEKNSSTDLVTIVDETIEQLLEYELKRMDHS